MLGTPLAGLSERRRTDYRLHTVGFVFQFFNLVPTLTAAENVELLAELTGPDAAKRTETCSTGSAWRPNATTSPPSSRAESSSACRSPAAW